MDDVLVIQNSSAEGLGSLEDLLVSDGFRLQNVFAKEEKIPQNNYSLLVVLGAPESANDNLDYLKDEMTLIRDFVKKEKPVLGICLGSQLIAKSFGAQVFRGVRKEIGFYHDLHIENTPKLFSGFENPFTVFHWHGDTFDLPQNAIRLVSSKDYENQAFLLDTAVGIQFHIEVTDEMINLWLDKSQELSNTSHIDPNKIKQEISVNLPKIKKNMEIFYKNFKSQFHL
ncbi:MAG TPA: gamma-glutamyl-gamma-aminobutyrate hydrolase family protein [Nitrosopumilaceae archaeon]|nr:gamma-glutamyl-gamma-aminobutyrate hydrolase family protein [Nitrosopumilaceae archaeon]